MITLYDPIRTATGTLTPIAKDADKKGKKETFYLCDHKGDFSNMYDGQFPVREKELDFLKKMRKKK